MGIKENRIVVIALFKYNKTPLEIINLLQPQKIMNKFVYRTIKQLNNLNTIADKLRSRHPRKTRKNAAVKTVIQRNHRNSLRKQKIMDREVKILQRTMSSIKVAYLRITGQWLTEALRQIRATKAKNFRLQQYVKNSHR